MKKPHLIISDKDYQETMIIVFDLMDKGEANLTKTELENIRSMAQACEKYENEMLNLKPIKQ